ncbi:MULTISPECIES: hypothetical protein [Deefgea]|uniref:Lipoprotein n=1 Tax=Deefgea chitinilytica TaxID=570276 RepID=A0ABS2C7B3_9NEIS|nr:MULTISPECIES: hypothetical protein [Deefgea]MBM5570046.1 hypothetical protein [Deefgea chitinilytica]MBM9887275.1 hypothetical protein [Deefgea sp. CFH1-16]
MMIAQSVRFLQKSAAILVTAIVCTLSACSSNPATNNNKPVATSDPVQKENQIAPSIIIKARSSKAITEDIIRYRTGKGMKIRSKSNLRLEFMMTMSNTTVPTEARMLYVLNQTEQGWRVTARVYQITHPGSQQEKVQEITAAVSDKLAEELATYAKISSKP